ncbi:MAG TPA: methyltransferase [Gemmataceae bacterium]|nr:methyltransferase [Gemmataceae bacterium]
MSRSRSETPLPPCYAIVHPGLEPVASEEIERELGGEVKRLGRGLVVFRVPRIDDSLLQLRTTEDVFLLAWGTDQLTFRAEDLDKIQRWTAREADWDRLLRLHHAVRPKPKARPTYRLITQMEGKHGYLRRDAGRALARGLAGKLPESWKPAEENAAVEIWLTIDGATAVCGLRLSDRTMRHRTYKLEHRPASLRPTLAAAMVRLAEIRPPHVVLDPMCGAGTLLAEHLAASSGAPWKGVARPPALGGDIDGGAVRAATANLRRLGQVALTQWDATQLPLADASVDRIVSNPPFGKQLGQPEEIGPLYGRMIHEYDRVLRPGGRAVLLSSDADKLRSAVQAVGWKSLRRLTVRILGQTATIGVWRKAGE